MHNLQTAASGLSGTDVREAVPGQPAGCVESTVVVVVVVMRPPLIGGGIKR